MGAQCMRMAASVRTARRAPTLRSRRFCTHWQVGARRPDLVRCPRAGAASLPGASCASLLCGRGEQAPVPQISKLSRRGRTRFVGRVQQLMHPSSSTCLLPRYSWPPSVRRWQAVLARRPHRATGQQPSTIFRLPQLHDHARTSVTARIAPRMRWGACAGCVQGASSMVYTLGRDYLHTSTLDARKVKYVLVPAMHTSSSRGACHTKM